MTAVLFSGEKGGVGTTTLAATVAALVSEHRPTCLLSSRSAADWAVHFKGLAVCSPAGDAGSESAERLWDARHAAKDNLWLFDTGSIAVAERDGLEAAIVRRLPAGGLVIVDTDPSELARYGKAFTCRVSVPVLGCDAVSLRRALDPRNVVSAPSPADPFRIRLPVLNLIDPKRTLCRDLEAVARNAFGAAGFVPLYFDAAVPEAAASGTVVTEYAPASQSATDIQGLADRLLGLVIRAEDCLTDDHAPIRLAAVERLS